MPPFYVFGYGSLIFAPELPGAVVERIPARLCGHRRAFNKRSQSRGCRRADSFDAFEPPNPDFRTESFNYSLVLGTEAAVHEHIDGLLLGYASGQRDAVLDRTDPREDYEPTRDARLNGYLRRSIEVERLGDGAVLRGVTYLTNHHPDAVYRAPDSLSLEDRARILINATPRRPISRHESPEARGLHYLEEVRRELRRCGIVDSHLEDLAAAARRLPGPWAERLSNLSAS